MGATRRAVWRIGSLFAVSLLLVGSASASRAKDGPHIQVGPLRSGIRFSVFSR